MQKIFIGMLLVFFDLTVNANGHVVGVLPDFVGYIFIFMGCREMSQESNHFSRAYPFIVGMAVYGTVIWVLQLFGITYYGDTWPFAVLSMAVTCVSLYIDYCIILGVRDMEDTYNSSFRSGTLENVWLATAIFSIAGVIALMLMPILGAICIAGGLAAQVVFLYLFYQAKKEYTLVTGTEASE
ncbi:MAG: hypothetical protein LUH58_07965 [Lachnospiraceae bacterium]|nr:hypothetical protein [Lachnospiraceae bacterium]